MTDAQAAPAKPSQSPNRLPKGVALSAMIMVLGALPPMLDTTIVNVAINGLAQTFGVGLAVMQWAVTGYVLALGVTVPFSGWLICRFDGKRIYMAAIALFVVGSLLSGLAWNAQSLIVFRIIQGMAAGVLMPLLSTMAVQLAGGSQNLGKLMSLIGIPVVFAPIIGPVIGGLIMQYLPWRWLFLINLPLGLIGLVGLQLKLPRFAAMDRSARLDWQGTVLLAVVGGGLVFGVTEVVRAADRAIGIVALAIALAALAVYLAYAFGRQRSVEGAAEAAEAVQAGRQAGQPPLTAQPQPQQAVQAGRQAGQPPQAAQPPRPPQPQPALIPPSLFRSRNFSAAFISLFLAGFAVNGPMLLFPLFFQNICGLSVVMAGLWLIPQGVGMLITRPLIGRLVDRIGARLIVLPAIVLVLAGTIPFVFFGPASSPWLIWAVLLVRGAGLGGITVPLMADSFVGLNKQQVPSASVATRIIQNIGSAFGSALLATVVSSVLASLTAGAASAAGATGGAAAVVGAATAAGSLLAAYHTGFVVSLAFMVVSVAPALFLTNRLGKKRQAAAGLISGQQLDASNSQ